MEINIKNNTVYSDATLALDLDTLSGDALDAAYTTIENELHTYTSFYRGGISYKDEFPSDDLVKAATGINTVAEYNQLKQKMLKSVFENGGFYVGRYETGIEDAPMNTLIAQTPVIKKNAYPYNGVTISQAQKLASDMESGKHTCSLMFGVQWDLVLKYLETKALEKGTELMIIQAELKKDSTSWGNYYNNLWNITNTSSKYLENSGKTWISRAYGEKTTEKSVILSTGASDTFCKQGIYDLAGNVWENTLEYSGNESNPAVPRAGSYNYKGYNYPVKFRSADHVNLLRFSCRL